MGRVWANDCYFTGGISISRPDRHIIGTLNPAMYRVGREGDFRYDIPLKPGVYELHLHFAEIVYGEDNAESAGDGARRFDIRLNGKPLLTNFNIVRDATGANVADERVFMDVSPAADGFLHLEFSSFVGRALLSGIEILPGVPGAAHPVRILSGPRVFYDRDGHFWGSDRYFRGGRTISRWNTVQETNEPQLYGGERWGYFSYSIPVPDGTYSLHLRFVEANFGSANFGIEGLTKGGVGSRILDVYCNGLALVRGLDIFKGSRRPLHGAEKDFSRPAAKRPRQALADVCAGPGLRNRQRNRSGSRRRVRRGVSARVVTSGDKTPGSTQGNQPHTRAVPNQAQAGVVIAVSNQTDLFSGFMRAKLGSGPPAAGNTPCTINRS